MSELMKSLAQSEQGYRTMHSSSPVILNHTHLPKRKNNLVLMVSLVLLPPIASIAYLGYDAKQSWQQQTERAMQTIERQKQLQSVPKPPLVTFLAYPELTELRAIDRSQFNINNVEADISPQVKQTGINAAGIVNEAKPIRDDLHLDTLDLSGLSSELAERVQDALDGEGSTQPQQTQYSSDEVETIELVNYEYVFRGKLPAMNLQTHMYASNEQSRWVKINGVERHEGDWVNDSVQVLTITPRFITVGFEGDVIEIPALYEWEG
ncbi:general secretion pathway protein GspB [Vibrio algarum]|uniref:General secretion pathway protein GspB n=1 Tax=Vibrio algarum TaxID=3020714 RepID=A0ABT4YN72_9VIBR|nr:general secretion pathway protein GspB [Vibrio sp. KJ40-1]MDB1122958.1 general secretion pathway protein GspB [Vibrio sp. KJ40-1]